MTTCTEPDLVSKISFSICLSLINTMLEECGGCRVLDGLARRSEIRIFLSLTSFGIHFNLFLAIHPVHPFPCNHPNFLNL